MSAAVYRSPGVVTVEERPVPRPGPGQVLVEVDHCGICGSDIHQSATGGASSPARWPGTSGPAPSPPWATTSTDWSVGERVVGGPRPSAGRAGGAGRASRRSARTAAPHHRQRRRRLRRVHPGRARPACCACPRGSRPGRRRWPSRWPWPCTASPARASRPGDTAMVIGAGPIGALTVARCGPWASTASRWSSRRKAASAWPAIWGPTEVIDPADLETFPPWEPETLSTRAVHVVLECSGRRRPSRPASTSCAGAASWSWSAPGSRHPTFDPNRMILNELHV